MKALGILFLLNCICATGLAWGDGPSSPAICIIGDGGSVTEIESKLKPLQPHLGDLKIIALGEGAYANTLSSIMGCQSGYSCEVVITISPFGTLDLAQAFRDTCSSSCPAILGAAKEVFIFDKNAKEYSDTAWRIFPKALKIHLESISPYDRKAVEKDLTDQIRSKPDYSAYLSEEVSKQAMRSADSGMNHAEKNPAFSRSLTEKNCGNIPLPTSGSRDLCELAATSKFAPQDQASALEYALFHTDPKNSAFIVNSYLEAHSNAAPSDATQLTEVLYRAKKSSKLKTTLLTAAQTAKSPQIRMDLYREAGQLGFLDEEEVRTSEKNLLKQMLTPPISKDAEAYVCSKEYSVRRQSWLSVDHSAIPPGLFTDLNGLEVLGCLDFKSGVFDGDLLNALQKTRSADLKKAILLTFIKFFSGVSDNPAAQRLILDVVLHDPEPSVRAQAFVALEYSAESQSLISDDLLDAIHSLQTRKLKPKDPELALRNLIKLLGLDHSTVNIDQEIGPYLQDSRIGVRAQAIEALGELKTKDPGLQLAVVRLLKSDIPLIAAKSAEALIRLRYSLDQGAVDELLQYVNESEKDPKKLALQKNALQALIKIPVTEETTEQFHSLFATTDSPEIKLTAMKYFENLFGDPDFASKYPWLLISYRSALDSPDPMQVAEALIGLSVWEHPDEETLRAAYHRLRTGESVVQNAAEDLLHSHADQALPIVEEGLGRMIQYSDVNGIRGALHILESAKSLDPETYRRVKGLLNDPREEVVEAAVTVFEAFPYNRNVWDTLVEQLQTGNSLLKTTLLEEYFRPSFDFFKVNADKTFWLVVVGLLKDNSALPRHESMRSFARNLLLRGKPSDPEVQQAANAIEPGLFP